MPRGRNAQRDAAATQAERLADLERQVQRLSQRAAGTAAPPQAQSRGFVDGGATSGGGARGGVGGGGDVARAGDWRCGVCNVFPCWARTRHCFKCGAPRGGGGASAGADAASPAARLSAHRAPATAVARREDYLGPRGAGGSRPMLGRWGATRARVGTETGGPRVGAAAVATPPAARPLRSPSPPAPPPQQRATRLADDGFQVAARGTRPAVGMAEAGGCDGPAAMDVAAEAAGVPATWAEVVQGPALAGGTDGDGGEPNVGGRQGDGDSDLDAIVADETGPADGDGDQDHGGSEEGDEEEDEDGDVLDDGMEEGAGGGEEQLRREWEKAREACRLLERASDIPHGLLATARHQRDQAEARWRASKQPHPLHKRLRWAQRDFDRAVAKEEAHRQELQRFDEEMAQRRKVLADRLSADQERTARQREKLDALQGQGARVRSSVSERAARVAATGIATSLGPTLAAIADRIEDNSPAWSQLQAAMATLHQVEGVLRRALDADGQLHATPTDDGGECAHEDRGGRPARYDISGWESGGGQRDAAAAPMAAGATTGACTTGAGVGRAEVTPSDQTGAPRHANGPKWTGQVGVAAGKWGGQSWRRGDGTGAGSTPAQGGAGGAPPSAGSSANAAEEARMQLARHQEQLAAAQARERAVAEAAQAQMAEAARAQQLQMEQQQRAAADAQAAADTLRRTQEAVAAAEAAEAQRLEVERQQLVARTSPEDMRKAAEVYAQQAALAAAGFGTAQAAAGAGMVQQQEMQRAASEAAARGVDADADRLMAMSEAELEEWNRGAQGTDGQVPW